MTFRDESKYNNIYPILNARTPNDINSKIYFYYKNKEQIIKKTEEAFNWFKENVIKKSLKKYFKLLYDEESEL